MSRKHRIDLPGYPVTSEQLKRIDELQVEMLELAEQHDYTSRLIGATRMPEPDPRVFYAFEMTKRV
ncbi:TPA: hypothetical protein HA249_01410 [Candidatus Woesearchaeota archaeon]|nr:hypothetical protein [Candidatus Woesearchaeota archaeon]